MSTDNRVLIIDYGLGNLKSVERAVTAAGGQPRISDQADDILKASKLILPGVGAFEAGMQGMRDRQLIAPLHKQVAAGVQLLGLCLGMQLLFETSEEFGMHPGLGFIKGTVKLLEPSTAELGYKIPHIGWNSLQAPSGKSWEKSILANVVAGEMVYFVHSFVPVPAESADVLAETEYGGATFTSVVAKGNVQGTQFHPEKSGRVGQKILKSFLAI